MTEPYRTLWPHLFGYFDFEAVYWQFADVAKPNDVLMD